MLAKIRSATFRQWVRPGDRLTVSAVIKTNREGMATAECQAEVGGKTVARADLLFSFVPMDTLAPGYRDDVLDDFLAARESVTGE